ncbi:MAG: ATP-binding protein [Elusimicrobiota bacterium]
MNPLSRQLDLKELLKKKSIFLLGPRSTGKTFLIQSQLPSLKKYDLLDSETYGKLARRPKLLEEELNPSDKFIVIDEIQRLPLLLNEVQRLIQNRHIHFLLTGSSARKLKRGGANLLGGRAWLASLFPLVSVEIPQFDLVRYFNRGGLPPIYLSSSPEEELRSYVDLYLREEIQAEALTRNLGAFARFLDVMALQNGEELHYEAIANDCAVPARTVQNYVQILEDTLLGFQVSSYAATRKRKAIARSKFFLFDIGVVNTLAERGEIRPKSELFGKCFEHFLMLEIRAFIGYERKHLPLQYWRSTSGFEVDCVIGNEWALEFKSTEFANEHHLKGLKALREEKLIKNYALVSRDTKKRTIDGIVIYPVLEFLENLWKGKLL